MNKDYVNTNN